MQTNVSPHISMFIPIHRYLCMLYVRVCAHICRVVYCQLFVAFIPQLLFLFLTSVFLLLLLFCSFIWLVFIARRFLRIFSTLHCIAVEFYSFLPQLENVPKVVLIFIVMRTDGCFTKKLLNILYVHVVYCIRVYQIYEISQITQIPQAYAKNFKDCNKIQNVSIACHIELSQDTRKHKQNWNSLK